MKVHHRLFDLETEPYFDLALFDGTAVNAVAPALARPSVYRVEPDELVLAYNQPSSATCIVLSGTLRVDLPSEEPVAAMHLGRGGCVGELSVIDGSLSSTSVRAVDGCKLLALQGDDVLDLADGSNAVARSATHPVAPSAWHQRPAARGGECLRDVAQARDD